jgi:acyl-ACP thioesterase
VSDALPVWIERHAIRASEMDFKGHLSVRALCELLQEAAGNHAQALGVGVDQLIPQGWTWVLREWQFEMLAWPRWRDEVTIETWPSGLDEMVATRDFRLQDGGGLPIGRATSRWMMVDFRRRRPIRMPNAVRAIRRPERSGLAADTLPRGGPSSAPGLAVDYRVRFADLDINEHVNNVSYVEWVLETVPREVLRGGTLAAMTIAFRAECRSESTVTVERRDDPERSAPDRPAFLHRVLEKEGARELVAARTLWDLPAGTT